MFPSFLAAFLLFIQAPECHPEHSEGSDTLKAAMVSSISGSIIVPQRITSGELKSASGLSEAVRRFAGVQLRDYGGVGGLKTVNVRSLGSEHTGVFIDGIQVDNAQNMQVDLGRFSLSGLSSVSLFSGQKVAPLQTAKEYSSASSLYLESADPVFKDGKRDNFFLRATGGSFMTLSPSAVWEHLLRGGSKLRLSAEALSSDGRYRFHVKDFRQYPDGTVAGYDTTMIRSNSDITSSRVEAMLFSPASGVASWNIHAYFYGSGRGLPGPVYKKAGEYPLSEDRQTDRDAFLQGKYYRDLGDIWSVAGRAKFSFSHLEYTDFPENLPRSLSGPSTPLRGRPARYNYRNHSAYLSATAMARIGGSLKVNLAQDCQYDYLDSDLRAFAYPGRFSSWSCASVIFGRDSFEASASTLYLGVRDSFISGNDRSSAFRSAFMPSLVFRWKPAERFTLNGFAKRSFRMPTFNDLYYTTVGTKTLYPENAIQLDLGAVWSLWSEPSNHLTLKVETYWNQLKNKIIAVPTSNQFRWSMYNLGRVEVLGADLTAEYSRKSGAVEFGLIGRYAYQRSRDKSDRDALTWNGQIPYIPLHSGSVNLFGEHGGWRLDLTAFMTGERFTTSANLPAYRLSPWTTLDAALSKNLTVARNDLTLKLCLNNLLDQQYEIVDNYPMPGFNFMLGMEYFF